MIFPFEWFREFLYWMSLPLEVLLGLTLIRQRTYRELPLFFYYVQFTVFLSLVRFIIYVITRQPSIARMHPYAYSYTYWATSVLGSVLGFLAVYEIFIRRLFAGYQKVRFFRYLFPAIAVAIVVIAIVTAIFSPNGPSKLLIDSDRILILMRVILLGSFTFLMIVMGRVWTRYELAVTFGFGVVAAASFFTSAMWMSVQYRDKKYLVSQLPTIAWDIACLIWLIAFAKRRIAEEAPAQPINPEILDEAKKWEGTLKEWLVPPKKKQ